MDRKTFWHHLKKFKFKSMLVRDFILFFTVASAMLASLSVTFYFFNRKITEDVISASNINALSKTADFVDLISKEADRVSVRIINDNVVKAFLKKDNINSNRFEDIEEINAVRSILSSSSMAKDYLYTVELYSYNNDYFISSNRISGKMSRMVGYSVPKNLSDKNIFVEPVKDPYTGEMYLAYYQKLYTRKTAESDGTLVVLIDMENFGAQIKNSSSKIYEDIFLLDENDVVLYGTQSDNIGKNAKDVDILFQYMNTPKNKVMNFRGEKLLVTSVNSEYKRWKMISFTSPEHYYDAGIDYLKKELILSVVIGILIAVLAAAKASSRMFEPINLLLELLENKKSVGIQKGKKQSAELEIIIKEILNNYEEKNKMEHQLLTKQIMLNKAESIALQAQINPHFLYNTLEYVNFSALRLTKSENEVSQMVVMLSKLLRFYLKTEETIISIDDELSYAKLYMEILGKRFGNAYDVIWNISDDLKNAKIVKVTLQPLLENAVNHGVRKGDKKGYIKINGFTSGNECVLEVINTGPPITKAKINEINSEMQKRTIHENSFIGLSNVNSRIKLNFGEEYGVLAALDDEGHTLIRVRFPRQER